MKTRLKYNMLLPVVLTTALAVVGSLGANPHVEKGQTWEAFRAQKQFNGNQTLADVYQVLKQASGAGEYVDTGVVVDLIDNIEAFRAEQGYVGTNKELYVNSDDMKSHVALTRLEVFRTSRATRIDSVNSAMSSSSGKSRCAAFSDGSGGGNVAAKAALFERMPVMGMSVRVGASPVRVLGTVNDEATSSKTVTGSAKLTHHTRTRPKRERKNGRLVVKRCCAESAVVSAGVQKECDPTSANALTALSDVGEQKENDCTAVTNSSVSLRNGGNSATTFSTDHTQAVTNSWLVQLAMARKNISFKAIADRIGVTESYVKNGFIVIMLMMLRKMRLSRSGKLAAVASLTYANRDELHALYKYVSQHFRGLYAQAQRYLLAE